MPVRLSPPELVDLVPAERVREIIALTDRDIAELERRANEACGEADQAELRAQESGVDGRSSTWAMVRMQRFLDGLRSEGERDAQALRDLAHERAELRLSDARAEAARIRGEVTPAPTVAPAPSAATVAPAVIAYVAPAPSPAPPVQPEAPADIAAPVVVPMPVPAARNTDVPAVDPRAVDVAASNGSALALVLAPPVEDERAVDDDPEVEELTSIDDLLRVPEVAADETPVPSVDLPAAEQPAPASSSPTGGTAVLVAPQEAPAADAAAPASEFWPQQETKPKKGLRRIPVSAVLEVLAVLLILVFILLRLS